MSYEIIKVMKKFLIYLSILIDIKLFIKKLRTIKKMRIYFKRAIFTKVAQAMLRYFAALLMFPPNIL